MPKESGMPGVGDVPHVGSMPCGSGMPGIAVRRVLTLLMYDVYCRLIWRYTKC